MRKTRLILAAVTVAVTLTGGLFAASRNDTADAAVGAVTFEDNFTGPSGAGIDGTKWIYEPGEPGRGNHERQWYTDNSHNVHLDGNGNLEIVAIKEGGFNCWYGPCQYTSGRVRTMTKFTQAYGHFEARIKIPGGQGIWPAFWMLGGNNWPTDGEIDVMENVGKEPNVVHGTIHGPGYSGAAGPGGSRDIGTPVSNDFHTYAVDWSPNLIVWTMDGVEYTRKTPADINGNRWVYDHPFWMLLNLAIGGDWPGDPDGRTQFPARMLVDYVRVNASSGGGGGGGGTPPPAGGNSLKSTFSQRCIDIPGGNASDGVRLQTWDCLNNDPQRWTFNGDGTLRAMGMCMDPAGGALGNGTPIQIVRCNGNPVQRFTLSGAGDLVNVSANRCVDVKDWNGGNGAALQLWDCGGTSNQKWTRA
jgi:beta-glucanase (GH16 family)